MKRFIVFAAFLAASLIITTQSALAGGGPCSAEETAKGKVTVCHVPPGNPGNPQTLCIGAAGVPAHVPGHVATGDHLGECASNPCGDGTCDEQGGEDCSTCELDCGTCEFCGDNVCNNGEDCGTCPGDCGACCGNGTCEPERDENCSTCEADCACGTGEACSNGACTSAGCCDVGTSHCFTCDPSGATVNPDCEGNTCVPASTCEITTIGRCSNPS